jgi:cysteine-rich repeat protein
MSLVIGQSLGSYRVVFVVLLAAACSSPAKGPDAADAAGFDGPEPPDAAVDAFAYDARWADASPFCGNMVVDTGEVCDDGNTDDGDGCSRDCHSLEVCGDGYRNPDEFCDSGGVDTATCDSDCTMPMCHDGHPNLPSGEACDTEGDAPTCDSDCTFPVCGDGHINPAFGEECESTVDTFVCDSDCTARMCGDGHVNMVGGEMCDSGDPAGSPACDPDCTPVSCGDGVTNTPAGEECDTGGDTSFCDADCTLAFCGDGYLNVATEVCDDGNFLSCGTCNSTCGAAIPASQATGIILCTVASGIADGDTLTVNDGLHLATVFEFDTAANGVAAGHVSIVPTGSPGSVCDQIGAAINGVGFSLLVTVPGAGSGTEIISLVNDTLGGFGNQPLEHTVVDPMFGVVGMSGGSGSDCPMGTPCAGPQVCGPPALICSSGICG